MIDLLVRRGRVVGANGEREQSIAVDGGRVIAVLDGGDEPAARSVVDAAGKLVFPGLVDSHVHFRDPGLTHKEDFASGSQAAAAGGVTTVMVMPTDIPFTTDAGRFADKIRLGVGRSHVDFALQAGLGADPGQVAELAMLGAISFELFMADLPPELLVDDVNALVACLEIVREAGRVAGVSPGHQGLSQRFGDLARQHGATAAAFTASRPPQIEALGVAQACVAADLAGVRMHLRQVSCAASLRAMAALRTERVTAEATPHNLTLTDADFARLGPVAKVLPPLRAAADVAALREALAAGAIDTVATDHAPHHRDEKAAGQADIWKAPGGFPGVQTLLPVMLGLVRDGVIDHAAIVRACCANPARIFGLYPRKGTLQPGSDADFVIVDPARPFTIRNEHQLSKAGMGPFDGLSVPGTPELAALRGTIVMREGRPVGAASGQFVRP